MSVLQPSASEKFRIINRNNQVFDGGKTVLEIIADFNSAGIDCDSIVCHAYDNSNGFGGFLPLKVGTKDAYYIGDENAGESLGTNTTLFQATENVWNGHFYRYQADWTLADFGAVSLSKRTINNIEYWYDYDGNVITPPMIYIGGNVGILYINDNPDIPTSLGGGAGSGYIGNSLVSNKKMVGYNVPTSSAEATKTESVNDVSATPVSGKPKSGNGFARIKFLRELDISNMTEWKPDGDFGWSVTYDDTTKENHIYGQGNEYWEYFECPISVKKNTNYVLSCQYKGTGMTYSTSNRDYLRIFNRFVAESEIRNNNGLYGISGLTIIAESSDYFDNNSTYRNISVSFNSGNLSEVWACIGFGYGDYDANIFDVYFKNIQLTEV